MAITASQADEAVMRVGISGGMTEVVADRGYRADEVIAAANLEIVLRKLFGVGTP